MTGCHRLALTGSARSKKRMSGKALASSLRLCNRKHHIAEQMLILLTWFANTVCDLREEGSCILIFLEAEAEHAGLKTPQLESAASCGSM